MSFISKKKKKKKKKTKKKKKKTKNKKRINKQKKKKSLDTIEARFWFHSLHKPLQVYLFFFFLSFGPHECHKNIYKNLTENVKDKGKGRERKGK